MTKEEQGKKLGQIISKAWEDEAFKQRLLDNATEVLKEEGVTVPEGMEIKAIENDEKTYHIVIPLKPGTKELSVQELYAMSGGAVSCNTQSEYPGCTHSSDMPCVSKPGHGGEYWA